MSDGGDFEPNPINIPGLCYSPGFESGYAWATQYSSELDGCLALSQGMYLLSNQITRDIEGKTAGICVNPWDFNFVKANTVDGRLVARPEGYSRTSYTPCDCSYHKCDRNFQGMGYTFDIAKLWEGDFTDGPNLGSIFNLIGGTSDLNKINEQLDSIGFPKSILNPSNNTWYYDYRGPNAIKGDLSAEEYNLYTQRIKDSEFATPSGSTEANLFTYAMIDLCGGVVTAGIALKNNIVSLLALNQSVLQVSESAFSNGFENGGDAWNEIATDIIRNYERNADIPGFSANLVYQVIPGLEGIQEKCMCVDAGLHGFDAHPFADWEIVQNQLLVEGDGIGGLDKFAPLGFFGTPTELATFLTISGDDLKRAGVTGAKPYRYGPNWLFGYGFSDLNVISVSVPEFKNWECRNSSKIRIAGSPNGEPYSFGNQWLEWGQRIGVPSIEYIPVSPITVGGGSFVDPNFGYKGSLEGSLIYRGKLSKDISPYEGQDYEFAFTGMRGGVIGPFNYLFGLTSIPQLDYLSNTDTYGISGSIEEIVFSKEFSESPQDKTIYRL